MYIKQQLIESWLNLFVLPALLHLSENRRKFKEQVSNFVTIIPFVEKLYTSQWSRVDGVGALVITPTRELAYQVIAVRYG